MADAKTTALTAATSWASGDLLYMVRTPGSTPESVKITLDNVLSKIVSAVNTKAIGVTGYSLTGSDATSMIDLAGTWNTSGNPVALKMAITNTNSGTTSKFISLLAGAAGATEVFSVDKAGKVSFTATANKGWTIDSSVSGIIQFQNAIGPNYSIVITGDITGSGGAARVKFGSGGLIEWGSAAAAQGGASDTILLRDAANTLALRNAANAQTFNVYNTYTSGSVYERGFMRWASNVLEIGTEHVGASSRSLAIKPSNEFQFGGAGAVQWRSDGSKLFPATTNNQDIGTSALRIKNQFIAGYQELLEMTAPSAAIANGVRIYAEDDGAGKTRLMALFASGAAQQIAIEP
jgi:hypothetical protein